MGTASVTVTREVAAPSISDISPASGSTVQQGSVTVTGAVASGASDVDVTVTVAGRPATIVNGTFSATVTLQDGPNTIDIVATDEVGQTSSASIVLVHDATPPNVVIASMPAVVAAGASYQVVVDATDEWKGTGTFAGGGMTVRDRGRGATDFAPPRGAE